MAVVTVRRPPLDRMRGLYVSALIDRWRGAARMTTPAPLIAVARAKFHASLLKGQLTSSDGVPSIADGDSKNSVLIAQGIVARIGQEIEALRLPGQSSGTGFENAVLAFLEETFPRLSHLRQGTFSIQKGSRISQYDQYAHLKILDEVSKDHPAVNASLGGNYLIKPDLVIVRHAESEAEINKNLEITDRTFSQSTPIRAANNQHPTLHASISCKWTIRSDRSQNSRSESLNLIRNRKGRLPHTVVVVGEPLPSRIASIALGTGDIDCVYHFALNELQASIREIDDKNLNRQMAQMVDGRRLRDISDLPFDLIV